MLIYISSKITSWSRPPSPSSGLLCDRWFHSTCECGALGSVKGQCASPAEITRPIEALGGQGYSLQKFIGCGFSCWKCVFVWLWQRCLPWILNCCPSRVLRPWPTCVNGQGHSGKGLPASPWKEELASQDDNWALPSWLMFTSEVTACKNMQKWTWMF